ncbi:tripartite tricarboxylate transporter substrate binding protein [Rubrivivax sp. RP6-9]|uniref:tripartite tricarboxylate transporter substrate binding protein n=1 Tax=Rubrivivax sp. RP6-9 TaxID=3415750 RepID=UPI003CC691B9
MTRLASVRRLLPLLSLVPLLLLCGPGTARAEPLRIVVPFPPGGAADNFARLVGQKLTEVSGTQVVVDNRAGAGGVLGSDHVAKAAPDGNTLLIVTVGHAVNPYIFSKLPYNTAADFVPVGMVASVPSLVVTGPSVAAKTLKDLLALAKARPGTVEFGSSGIGSTSHVGAALIEALAGVDLLHVPYKGAAAALQDVMGGRTAMSVDIITSSVQLVRSGKLTALATTGPRRSPLLPEVPTVAEAGIPGYAFTAWYMLLAPAKTPPAVVEKLNAELRKVEALPDFRSRIEAVGGEVASLGTKETAAFLDAEFQKWAQVVKARNIKAD